jgi:hypothetical protein
MSWQEMQHVLAAIYVDETQPLGDTLGFGTGS